MASGLVRRPRSSWQQRDGRPGILSLSAAHRWRYLHVTSCWSRS